jgi:hypothetical protein
VRLYFGLGCQRAHSGRVLSEATQKLAEKGVTTGAPAAENVRRSRRASDTTRAVQNGCEFVGRRQSSTCLCP